MTRSSFLLLIVGACVLISGCTPIAQVPERVLVRVPVPCVDAANVPPRPPVRTQQDLLAMPRFQRTLAAWQDLKRWEAYAEQMAALVSGCAALPQG